MLEHMIKFNITHPFTRGGMCMSRCVCGKTFSDPVHGKLPSHLDDLRRAARGDIRPRVIPDYDQSNDPVS